jgi:GntR family transcriptional regulator/MocR family aminotransferase
VIAPPSLLPAIGAARPPGTQQAVLEQMVLADFIADGHFERHVRRMRAVYAERQQDRSTRCARSARSWTLLRRIGDDPWAGYHSTATTRRIRRAAARGVDAIPLSAFAVAAGRAGQACCWGTHTSIAHDAHRRQAPGRGSAREPKAREFQG